MFRKSKHIIKYYFIFAAVAAIAVIVEVYNPSLAARLFIAHDRQNIFEYSITLIKNRPLFGYGGNSIDYIYDNIGKYNAVQNWGHTHNTLLEICVRYGLISTIFLLLFFVKKYKTIPDKDDRFMYLFLLVISLFQIYFRNFNFIFMLMMITNIKRGDSLVFEKKYQSIKTQELSFV